MKPVARESAGVWEGTEEVDRGGAQKGAARRAGGTEEHVGSGKLKQSVETRAGEGRWGKGGVHRGQDFSGPWGWGAQVGADCQRVRG